jgi:hypothetical protein
MSGPLDFFKNTFNQLDKDHLDLLDEIYAPDVKFHDPVHELSRSAGAARLLRPALPGVLSCEFDVRSRSDRRPTGMLVWIMRFQHRRFRRGEMLELRGVSHLKFNDDGKGFITTTISTWANLSTSGRRFWAA